MNMPLRIGELVDFVQISKPIERPEPKRWRLALVVPQKEFAICRRFNENSVRAYVPREIKLRRSLRVDRSGKNIMIPISAPIFPRIVFVAEDDAQCLDRLREISQGVSSFVTFGLDSRGMPNIATANVEAMAKIREIERFFSTPASKRKDSLKFRRNQDVRATGGPLCGFSGRITHIERLDSKGRVKVLFALLGRSVEVEIHETQIEPI